MILRPKPFFDWHLSEPAGTAATSVATVPNWLRHAIPGVQAHPGKDVDELALTAGAALGALDAVVRQQQRWAGAWRQRLALSAAAETAKRAARHEDENALRDAVLLTKAGDDVGPAGRMLLAWRRLAERPAETLLTTKNLCAVLEEFGYSAADEAVSNLAGELRRLSSDGIIAMLTGAFFAAERYGFGRVIGGWLADALVAQRLGWPYAVPLLGTDATAAGLAIHPRRSGNSGLVTVRDASLQVESVLAAQARAALRAIDLSSELGRRGDRLLAVAPKLRAKAANTVVEMLLSADAVVASEKIAGMSDRGLRRLFDRLVELGAVRELSGRPTFRIYGI